MPALSQERTERATRRGAGQLLHVLFSSRSRWLMVVRQYVRAGRGRRRQPKVDPGVESAAAPRWVTDEMTGDAMPAHCSSPSTRARATACVRLAAASLPRMWPTCFLIVAKV